MKWMWRNIREQEETGDVMLAVHTEYCYSEYIYIQTNRYIFVVVIENGEEYMGGSFRFRFSGYGKRYKTI